MDLKKYTNKTEMKEHKKTIVHLLRILADVGYFSYILSSLTCFCTYTVVYLAAEPQEDDNAV